MRFLYIVLCLVITSAVSHKSKRRLKSTCGGLLTDVHGVIQTPEFPARFPVPIHCQWVIDASSQPSNNASIIVYFTQLFALKGLTFTEYAFYDSSSRYGERLIHTVTEQNVVTVQWIQAKTMFLLIDFNMKELEGNQVRALDGLLDVFGFNITYEISTKAEPVRPNPCSVADCSFVGHCFAAMDFSDFWCQCFEGFSGPNCGHGPLCEEGRSMCQNGATCRHAGANTMACLCPPGFNGTNCNIQTSLIDEVDDCGESGCVSQCPFDGQRDHVCNCPLTPQILTDKARFECIVRLASIPTFRDVSLSRAQLELLIERQLSKYMKNSNLSKMDDLRVLNISSGAEVTFHFFGAKKDGNRVRDALNRLVQRGRLGNLTFVPTYLSFHQEPTLLLQSVKVNRHRVIREGDEFIISCVAQGSTYMTFQWYKDGVFVNTTKAIRAIWTHLEPMESREQYTATLGISKANYLDEGVYTCQVEDWGVQHCKSVHIEVRRPPEVQISPKSVTVQKGDNVSIVCVSPNDRRPDVFGYNWTKNKLLFKMKAGTEVWEELYPAGSILKISNVQKSAVYSCEVIGYVTTTVNVRVEVLNKTVVPLCSEDTTMGITWSETCPGVSCIKQCPPRYIGDARRLCTLRDVNDPDWDLPDFSTCFSETLVTIQNNFRRLTFGYQNTTSITTMSSYLHYLNNRPWLFPGEGEYMLDLVHDVVSYLNTTYINTTESNDELYNVTRTLYHIVDALLKQEFSILDITKLVQLQRLVRNQALLSGALLRSPAEIHDSLDTITIDVASLDSALLHNLNIPLRQNSNPWRFPDKLDVRTESSQNEVFGNGSFTIAVIVYTNLSSFFPSRSVADMRNGNHLEYEIISRLVSVSLGRELGRLLAPPPGSLWLDMGLHHVTNNYSAGSWNVTCAVADVAATAWDMNACSTVAYNSTYTKCTCARTGVFAILLTKKSSHMEQIALQNNNIELLGCMCCLVQSLIAMGALALYWWYYQSCLGYLKIQCCGATIGAMAVFIFAIYNDHPKESYPYITNSLETFLLVGMSSHISKILIVYTELVQISKVKHLKSTVVGIITGVPVIVIFGTHLAHRSVGPQLEHWWLQCDTLIFNIFVTATSVMFILFIFLYVSVMHKLQKLVTKHVNDSKVLNKRIGLLRRSALVFVAMVAMVAASIIYVNDENIVWQYVFSTSSAVLGLLQLLCYIVKSEDILYSQIAKHLNLHGTDEDISSNTANSPYHFFTKQDPEAESECVPPRVQRSIKFRLDSSEGLLLPDQHKIKYVSSDGTIKTYLHGNSEEVIPAEHYQLETQAEGKEVEVELYSSSPKKYQKILNSAADYSESEKMYPEHWTLRETSPTSTGYLTDRPDILTTPLCSKLDLVPAETPLKEALYCDDLKLDDTLHKNTEIVEELEVSLESKRPEECSQIEDDNLDGMLDRISNDLDYLLNRTITETKVIPEIQITSATLSNKSSSIIWGQIKEEEESIDEILDESEELQITKSKC